MKGKESNGTRALYVVSCPK